jgi:hypothetical protein
MNFIEFSVLRSYSNKYKILLSAINDNAIKSVFR